MASDPGSAEPRRTLVAIPTTGRRVQLRRLVASIAGRSDVAVFHHGGEPDVDLARFCDGLGAVYHLVASPGIAAVRNAALDFARSGSYEYVAFIDDDEEPRDPTWPSRLVERCEDGGLDACFGPVLFELPPDAPQWLRRSRVFERPVRPASDDHAGDAYSGNTVIRLTSVEGLRFDDSLSATGGEDTAFFRALRDAGGRVGYEPGAVAVEIPDPERLRLRSMVAKSYAVGSQAWLLDAATQRPSARWAIAGRKIAAAFAGVGAALFGLLRADRGSAVRGALRVATAAGFVAAAIGRGGRYYAPR